MNPLQRVLADIVKSYGYKASDIRLDISYCQGSGACFVGEEANVPLIINRLMEGDQRDRLLAYIQHGTFMIRVTHSERYCNPHAMTVDAEPEHGPIYEAYPNDREEQIDQDFADLIEAIEEDIKTVAKHLERYAYQVADATLLTDEATTFNRAGYTVRVSLESDEEVLDLLDAEDVRLLSRHRETGIKAGSLRVSIFEPDEDGDFDEGDPIAERTLGRVIAAGVKDEYVSHLQEELLTELFQEHDLMANSTTTATMPAAA